MTYLMAFIVGLAVALGVALLDYLVRATTVWRRFRGARVVTCPEDGCPAAVRIDRPYAAITEVGNDRAAIRLAACSRWAPGRRCSEACLAEAQDPGRAVSEIASRWYAGRACVYCGAPIGADWRGDSQAALLAPDGTTREWTDVPAEMLPDALRVGRPVCWPCHASRRSAVNPSPATRYLTTTTRRLRLALMRAERRLSLVVAARSRLKPSAENKSRT